MNFTYTVFSKSQNPHNVRTLVFVRPIIIVVRTPLIMMRGRPSTKCCWALTDSDQLGLRVSPKNHRIYWNNLWNNLFQIYYMTGYVWWLSEIYLIALSICTWFLQNSSLKYVPSLMNLIFGLQTGSFAGYMQSVNIKFCWVNANY